MSDRVWLVSSGSYSDYRVHCAAPSKKAAQSIVAALNGADGRRYFAEPVPVIENAERVTVYGNEAIITDAGTVREESVRDRDEWNVDPLYPERLRPVTVRWVRAPECERPHAEPITDELVERCIEATDDFMDPTWSVEPPWVRAVLRAAGHPEATRRAM